MSGPHRGAWPVDRRLVLALVPVLVGVLIFAARGDRSPGTPSRLAATGTAPLLRAAGLRPLPPGLPALDDGALTGPATATATAGLDTGPVGVADEPVAATATPTSDGRLTTGGDQAAGGGGASLAADGAAPAASAPQQAGTTAPATTTAATTAPATTTAAAAPAASAPAASTPVNTADVTTTEATTTTVTTTPPPTTTTTAAAPAGGGRLPGVEADVVPLTNRDRTAAGLGALTRNSCLDSIAAGYAQQLARNGVLAHNPAAASAIAGCRPAPTWGDNIGTASPCSASLLEDRWMASPTHRENIMTPAFQYIGVGAWTDDAGACWVQVLFSS